LLGTTATDEKRQRLAISDWRLVKTEANSEMLEWLLAKTGEFTKLSVRQRRTLRMDFFGFN
jgi:hypothetical protein